MDKKKKWEYLNVRTVKGKDIKTGEYGKQGWELIAVVPIDSGKSQDYRLFFKREL